MSTNTQDQEIDLGKVLSKIKDFFNSFFDGIFDLFLFIKRNIIVIAILFIIGGGVGFYMDRKDSVYEHTIIVRPNFGSTDYLYNQVNLLNAKRKQNDTLFFKAIGLKNIKNFREIEVEPIIDIYSFIQNSPEKFELLKLMAEEGSINTIIENEVTGKNYPFHAVKLITSKETKSENTIVPILKFLNSSDYFEQVKQQQIENIQNKIFTNEVTISQIDSLLNEFIKSVGNNNQKSTNLIYNNENNQLNELIQTKEKLITNQGQLKSSLIEVDSIIKDISTTINIKDSKGLHNKMKLIVPFILIVLFFIFSGLRLFYKKQIQKRELA
ncbi:hypothetical protein ACFS5J_09450 [Flavobacterium chuncheonense]|uniref:Polysaccharide chain length determinant N-terminal domain-containing protein n=1 Tax=Flavobacterium chuncheonense TaxID=2026653 RepID=A0ABW5YMI8_9FLAO